MTAVLIFLHSVTWRAGATAPQEGNTTAPPEAVAKQEAPTQERDLEALELMELDIPVVVTAGRREQPINLVPQAVTVITAEDIRLSGARSIADALRLAAGMDVAELSSGAAAISPRGFHGFVNREVLVLVDGRQIFDSLYGGSSWFGWPMQLDDIDRIEIIRGPAGVTWGANALCGVINIISKDPAETTGFTMTLGGGSRGINQEHLGYSFTDGALRLRLSGEHESHDGFVEGGSMIRSGDDEVRVGRSRLFSVYDVDQATSFTFAMGNALIDGAFPAAPLTGLGLSRNSGSQASFVQGRWTRRHSADDRTDLTLYANDYQSSPGVPTIDYRYQQIGVLLSRTTRPIEAHAVTWGFDARVDLLDTSNSDPMLMSKDFASTGIFGIYLQDEWRFAPRWALNLGARVDYECYGGFQPSGRAALSYELDEGALLYGAVSRAFQMPSVGLRFLDFPMLNGLAWVKGDRDLGDESINAFELGYRARWWNRLEMSATPFWHDVNNVTTLEKQLAPPTLLRLDLDNRSDAKLYGVEWEARYKASDQLTLLGNYTFQEFAWESTDSTLYEKDIMDAPRHKAMIGARYSVTDDIRLSGHAYWVGGTAGPEPTFPFVSRSIDPYLRLDLLAEIDLWKDQATLSVGVKNLLDPSHPEGTTLFLNDAEAPRIVFAQMRIAIK